MRTWIRHVSHRLTIASLLAEPKAEVDDRKLLRDLTTSKPKDGHRRHSITVDGGAGSAFQLALRQSVHDPYDFSVILIVVQADGAMNLRRHNGPTHQHRNPIEGERFRGEFHIHTATERYQERGNEPEHYAVPTNEFSDLATALTAMLTAATFKEPPQLSLDRT